MMKKKLLMHLIIIFGFIGILGGYMVMMTIEVGKDTPDTSQPIIEFFMTNIAPSIIRNSAKIFISAVNLDKLKASGIKHLEDMTDEKFLKEFQKVLLDINKLKLKEDGEQIGLKKGLTRKEAIVLMENQDKEKLLTIFDSIPDEVISNLIKNNFFSRTNKIVSNKKDLLLRLDGIKKNIEQLNQ